jgi:[ribosomal protein S5]-alanine N-acetyltransferase
MAALQAAGSARQLVVVDKASNAAIGTCLLFRFEPASGRAELGYVLGRSHWGHGYMAEALAAVIGFAFGSAGLRRIEAEVNPDNTASMRLLHKLGFTQEGVLRQRWVTRGEPYDVAVFGLLSHEWRGTNPVDPLPRQAGGVVLRRLRTSDLVAFQAYRADPELGRYQGWSAMTDAKALEFLNEVQTAPLFEPGAWVQIGIAEPDSEKLLGDIGLFLNQDATEAEIGFTLARPAHGRGLATAAVRAALHLVFEATSVQRVLGITDARNLASIRLLERVGMRRIDEREVEFRGERCVEWVYAIDRG